MDATKSGIAFATPTLAQEALARPHATVPQAILCTLPFNGNGVGGWIGFRDSKGRAKSVFRYLFQIGTGTVQLDMSKVAHGVAVTHTTTLEVRPTNEI